MVFGFSDIFTVMEGERMFAYQTRRHVVSFFFSLAARHGPAFLVSDKFKI